LGFTNHLAPEGGIASGHRVDRRWKTRTPGLRARSSNARALFRLGDLKEEIRIIHTPVILPAA